MNVAIVKIGRSSNLEQVAQNMASTAQTNSLTPEEFDIHEVVDLLVVGFDANPFGHKEKRIREFISQLDRQHIKNIALFSAYSLSNRMMKSIVQLCEDRNLPLMREQFCCRFPFKANREVLQNAIDDARDYIEDMITICRNYY